LDREYLEDYEQRERNQYERFLRDFQEGKFSSNVDKYPPDNRFVNIRKPVALAFGATFHGNLWTMVPFCGSVLLTIPPIPQSDFERLFFKAPQIPEIIDFIKETGRLQIALSSSPQTYRGLDYLEPIFNELNPPELTGIPIEVFGDEKAAQKAHEAFFTLGRIKFFDFLAKECPQVFYHTVEISRDVYTILTLGRYSIVEDIENLMVDDPRQAFLLFRVYKMFIVEPLVDMRCDIMCNTLEEIKRCRTIPILYRPKDVRFPCEIGRFLTKKLTYAPKGLDACKELMYHYDAYDLQRVHKSLNEAIVANKPDVVNASVKEVSEILDDVWNDKTIPNKIKNIQIGVPVSIAAVGGIVAGLPGLFAGGFLSELGFKVVEKATEKYAEKLFRVKGEGLTERLAKLRTKSYQANIYDFKKTYNK
jgi:hypothetical protein